jgi:hypothetical protein
MLGRIDLSKTDEEIEMPGSLLHRLHNSLSPKRLLQHKALKEGLAENYLTESHMRQFPKVVLIDDEIHAGDTTYRIRVRPHSPIMSIVVHQGGTCLGVLSYDFDEYRFRTSFLPGVETEGREIDALYESVMRLNDLDAASRNRPPQAA